MYILKKTYSKHNNEIDLIGFGDFCVQTQKSPSNNLKIILIIGVVHGDEPQGKFLIENYMSLQKKKRQSCIKNKLLFIPCLNPDGLALKTRQNGNGVDLNRNFPVQDVEKHTFTPEIETKFVVEIVEEYSPDIILTLHAPYKVVNYDGSALEFAQNISKIINYPVESDIGYPTPGSFGTYAGIERNIPIITLELDEEIDMKELITPINKIFDYLAEV